MKNSPFVRKHIQPVFDGFFKYQRGLLYLYMRYVVAPRILNHPRPLEKPKTRDDFSIHMIFGKRDFLMALWSLASFYRVMPEIGQLFLHSDGTLGDSHYNIIRRLYPSARIEDTKKFLELHGNLVKDYPILKKFRETYKKFQIRIVDYHFLSGKKYRMFVDSDLLWFKEPTEIVASLRAGVPKFLMASNSVFVRMQFKDGTWTDDKTSLPNDGIVLYREDQLDPKKLEAFLEKCDYINLRLGDQAWLSWSTDYTLLPDTKYIIKGTLTDDVVVRHYTAPQRPKFFLYGLNRIWRKLLPVT